MDGEQTNRFGLTLECVTVVERKKGLRPEDRPSQKQLSLADSVSLNRGGVNARDEQFGVV
jgi:hypothetical protein